MEKLKGSECGQQGNGVLSVEDFGMVSVGEDLSVGLSGHGELNVNNGGVVVSTFGHIGHKPGSTGEAMVTGSDSRWINSDFLGVGENGWGSLSIIGGGEVFNTYGYIGFGPDSTGRVWVNGNNSHWNNSQSLYIGGTNTQAGGDGVLTIDDSGLVTVSNTTKLVDIGTINLDGGTLDTGTLDLTEGTFNMTDGYLHVDHVIGDLNNQAGSLAPDNSAGMTTISGDYTQGAAADIDMSSGPNNLDITPFIGLLTAASATAVPEPGSLVCVVLALMMGPRRVARRKST